MSKLQKKWNDTRRDLLASLAIAQLNLEQAQAKVDLIREQIRGVDLTETLLPTEKK